MPDPHTFLWSWLAAGASMWLSGSWTEAEVARLYAQAEAQRALAPPLHCWLGGSRVQVVGPQAGMHYLVGVN